MFLERISASTIEYIHKCKILKVEVVYFKVITLLNLFFIFYSWYVLNELLEWVVSVLILNMQTPIYLPKVLARTLLLARPADAHKGPNSVFQEQGRAASLWRWEQCSLLGQRRFSCSVAARVGSGYQHHLLRKALSASESPKRTVGHGQPGVPGRSPGPGPGR